MMSYISLLSNVSCLPQINYYQKIALIIGWMQESFNILGTIKWRLPGFCLHTVSLSEWCAVLKCLTLGRWLGPSQAFNMQFCATESFLRISWISTLKSWRVHFFHVQTHCDLSLTFNYLVKLAHQNITSWVILQSPQGNYVVRLLIFVKAIRWVVSGPLSFTVPYYINVFPVNVFHIWKRNFINLSHNVSLNIIVASKMHK